jgi:hypothetical protein
MNKIIRYSSKFFVLIVMCAALALLLGESPVGASAARDGCYSNYQSCLNNNCPQNPDGCVDTCIGPYDECIWQLPVDNFNTCIQQCPQCIFGETEDMNACTTAFSACKARCLSGGSE